MLNGFHRHQDLADAVECSRSTVSNFLNGQPVDRRYFEEICNRLGLDWQEIADNPDINPLPDPNFVGREGAIEDLNTLVSEGAKVIGIYGKGGVGKTTLAQRYFDIQGIPVRTLLISLKTEDITPVEDWIRYWLRHDFHEEPSSQFGIMLDQLKCKLQAHKIGVLVDNLEPALDAKGKFITAHERYVDLLRVLADPSVRSITLITSRDRLNESSVNVQPYELPGLDEQAWQEFFENHDIKVSTDSSSLSKLNRDYGGNAKAMEILSYVIKNDFAGNLEAYLQDHHEDLLIEGDLEDLVVKQFNRLQQLDSAAYKLLCRLGCYRYQDVPKVPIQGFLCLLWDVPEAQRRRVIRSLRDRALVEFYEGEYWLHPVIRAEAIRRLRASEEEWQVVNQKAAEFYSDYSNNNGAVSCKNQLQFAFEAITHFYEIQDFERGYQILLYNILEIKNNENLENLTVSENLWSNQGRILRICEQALEALSDEQKIMILIPMGYIYSACGVHSSLEIWREDKKHEKALDISYQILGILKKISQSNTRSVFAEMSAHLIASKANRFIGRLSEAINASKEANRIAKRSGKSYWKALALYEIGLVYLEIDQPRIALRRIVAAAFLASIGRNLPMEVYQISKKQITNLSYQVEYVFDKYNAQNEASRRKKIAVLLNIARCLNLMRLYPLSKTVLDIIERNFIIQVMPDNCTGNCLFFLEKAIYFLGICNDEEAIENYEKALELSNHKDKGFREFILIKFGNWKYNECQYREGLKKYEQIEDVPKEVTDSSIKAQAYYQISCIYLKCNSPNREKAIDYLKKAKSICQELELPLLTEVMKLEKTLETQGD